MYGQRRSGDRAAEPRCTPERIQSEVTGRDALLTHGTGRVALFGGSLLANSGPLAPRGSPAASGRARPERDGSEPVSGRRARRAAGF
ncbi:hypothetical protein NDU88_002457 [Pleurodeles waltl]|uniref:Uncharacterized protein n=1 Tax=Pleurodeles waltl TaxID=8319 RepID=A0AAV7UX96_PLEWA|nr:hypothetical protein NDU88_002457 [Pleurodeles waltl]